MTSEQISQEMTVIAEREDSLVRVARAVDAVSVNLAHHAAWTDERFDSLSTQMERLAARMDELLKVKKK